MKPLEAYSIVENILHGPNQLNLIDNELEAIHVISRLALPKLCEILDEQAEKLRKELEAAKNEENALNDEEYYCTDKEKQDHNKAGSLMGELESSLVCLIESEGNKTLMNAQRVVLAINDLVRFREKKR